MDNEYKKIILMQLIGNEDLNNVNNKLILNYDEYVTYLMQMEQDYRDDQKVLEGILECRKEISEIYRNIISNYLSQFLKIYYPNYSIDFVLTREPQEEIKIRFEEFSNNKGLPLSLKEAIESRLELLADRLDHRFIFDDLALINLIEASCGKNIIDEQGSISHNLQKVVSYDDQTSKYNYTTSNTKDIYTADGTHIIDPRSPIDKSASNIMLRSFPMGNEALNSSNNAMMMVMRKLFDNLNLCIETYQAIYLNGNNTIQNTVTLTDGKQFQFEYIINEKNLPHLLGIQKANTLSQDALDYLNLISNKKPFKLTSNSKAFDVLIFISANQEKIIASGGLYTGRDGKEYEIMNWEKVVLKTSSFMRCDFFKTCFCLAQLSSNNYLNDKRDAGGYVGIASTEYGKGLNSSRTAISVLNDLLKTRKQKKDFIFRGFHFDETTNSYIPNSIMTGKAETIHVGKDNELLKSLERYREMFDLSSAGGRCEQIIQEDSEPTPPTGGGGPDDGGGGNSKDGDNGVFDLSGFINDEPISLSPFNISSEVFSSIVEKIENENYIQEFSPEEIAQLGLDIGQNLGFAPVLSEKSLDIIKDVDGITYEEFKAFEDAYTSHTRKF